MGAIEKERIWKKKMSEDNAIGTIRITGLSGDEGLSQGTRGHMTIHNTATLPQRNDESKCQEFVRLLGCKRNRNLPGPLIGPVNMNISPDCDSRLSLHGPPNCYCQTTVTEDTGLAS